jgi:ComF family protein
MPILELLRKSVHVAGELLWPRRCMICDGNMPEDPSRYCLCPICIQEISHDPFETCRRCASSIGPHSITEGGCPRCRNEHFQFSSAVRFGLYDGKLRDAILRMKHLQSQDLAEALGENWAMNRSAQLLEAKPQVIVPVPLHRWRRWQRGYNQADAVARGLAFRLNLPVNSSALKRIRATPPQTAMTIEGRRENVANAFYTTRNPRVAGLRVLLVDDVLTTGATADAAARVLLSAGAAQVDVAVLAHR